MTERDKRVVSATAAASAPAAAAAAATAAVAAVVVVVWLGDPRIEFEMDRGGGGMRSWWNK